LTWSQVLFDRKTHSGHSLGDHAFQANDSTGWGATVEDAGGTVEQVHYCGTIPIFAATCL